MSRVSDRGFCGGSHFANKNRAIAWDTCTLLFEERKQDIRRYTPENHVSLSYKPSGIACFIGGIVSNKSEDDRTVPGCYLGASLSFGPANF